MVRAQAGTIAVILRDLKKATVTMYLSGCWGRFMSLGSLEGAVCGLVAHSLG